jgi:ornithine cyclodeaminase
VLALQAAGRTSVEQVTVFDSVGFALEDYSALHFLHDAALELGIGQRLPLVPQPADPKDLFATLRRQTARA